MIDRQRDFGSMKVSFRPRTQWTRLPSLYHVVRGVIVVEVDHRGRRLTGPRRSTDRPIRDCSAMF